MPAFINLTDQMFQCFKVLERDYEYPILNNLKSKHTYWKCQSKCGQIKTYSINEIRRKQKLLQEYNCEKCSIFQSKDLTGMILGNQYLLNFASSGSI